MTKYKNSLRGFMSITKALADETRVRMLMALSGGELCVCQVTGLFGLAPSTVSKHLSILHQAGLVQSRKAERWVYYRLPGPAVSPQAGQAVDFTAKCLKSEPRIVADAKKLKGILKVDPVILCKSQIPK